VLFANLFARGLASSIQVASREIVPSLGEIEFGAREFSLGIPFEAKR
jgi:hypothetical protein